MTVAVSEQAKDRAKNIILIGLLLHGFGCVGRTAEVQRAGTGADFGLAHLPSAQLVGMDLQQSPHQPAVLLGHDQHREGGFPATLFRTGTTNYSSPPRLLLTTTPTVAFRQR